MPRHTGGTKIGELRRDVGVCDAGVGLRFCGSGLFRALSLVLSLQLDSRVLRPGGAVEGLLLFSAPLMQFVHVHHHFAQEDLFPGHFSNHALRAGFPFFEGVAQMIPVVGE